MTDLFEYDKRPPLKLNTFHVNHMLLTAISWLKSKFAY